MRGVSLVLVICGALLPAAALAQAPERGGIARIVVVHSAGLGLAASTLMDPPMREALERHSRRPVVIDTEELRALTMLALSDEARAADELATDYADKRVDLVMPVGIVGLDFVLRHRHRLWPGVPVVFLGVGRDLLASERIPPDVSGVTASAEVERTLALARALQPGVRQIAFVSGASPYDLRWQRLARRAMAEHAADVPSLWLVGLPLPQLLERVKGLDRRGAIIFLSHQRDVEGREYASRDVVRRLAAASAVPVYGVLEGAMGHGIAGGWMQNFQEHGRQAGLLAAQLLNGERSAQRGEVLHTPASCQADERELRRWDLDAARLPPGCVVRFAAPVVSLLDPAGRTVAAGLLVVLLGLTAVAERRRRLRAERRTRAREQDLAHAARLNLLGQLSASVTHEVRQPLAAIMTNVAAAEYLLQEDAPDVDELKDLVHDIRKADVRAQRVIDRLTEFLRKREARFDTLELNDVVEEAIVLVKKEAERRQLQLNSSLSPLLDPVRGDRVQLTQVVLNLLLNAFDSSEPGRSGVVAVRTWQDGREVVVEVADQGRGIRSEDLPRLFESFFTTKEHGMGMGLAIARMVMEAHRGRIQAANRPEGGAVFRCVLPAG